MKKLIVKLAIVLIIGVILLGVAGTMLFGPASRGAVEKGTTYALGVDAELGKVDASVGVDSSHLGLVNYQVHNPQGFTGDPFLEVGELSVDLRTLSVISKTITVPAITLDGLHLRLVQDGKRSNFKEILDHLRSLDAGGESSAASEAPAEDSGKPGPKLMVGEIDLRDIQLAVEVTGIPGLSVNETFKAKDLHIDVAQVVRETDGLTLGGVIGLVVDKLVEHGVTEAGEHVSPEALELLTGGLEGLQARLGEKVGELKEQAEQVVDEKVEELKSEAEDELQKQKDATKAKLDAALEEGRSKLGEGLGDLLKKKD